jgi:hypothetical protein
MTKRGRRLPLTAPPAWLALLVALWLLVSQPHIIAENVAKVRPGMAVAEVEALLGSPAAYTMPGRTPATFGVAGESPPWMRAAAQQEWWVGDDAAAQVFFDADGWSTLPYCRSQTPGA